MITRRTGILPSDRFGFSRLPVLRIRVVSGLGSLHGRCVRLYAVDLRATHTAAPPSDPSAKPFSRAGSWPSRPPSTAPQSKPASSPDHSRAHCRAYSRSCGPRLAQPESRSRSRSPELASSLPQQVKPHFAYWAVTRSHDKDSARIACLQKRRPCIKSLKRLWTPS